MKTPDQYADMICDAPFASNHPDHVLAVLEESMREAKKQGWYRGMTDAVTAVRNGDWEDACSPDLVIMRKRDAAMPNRSS